MRDNIYQGYPMRLYRTSDEIRSDIRDIKDKINDVNTSLSVRELLLDILSDGKERAPGEWVSELEGVVYEAENAEKRLKELCEELNCLRAELSEVGWRIRG